MAFARQRPPSSWLRGERAMESTDVVKALSRPEAYLDHPAEVSMQQTHISWLIFTKDFVYKVKKPVNFGFLDFTSLDARRHFCDEEVRLNRRLAPEVYLGVRAVTAADGEIRLGGRGDVIDYARRSDAPHTLGSRRGHLGHHVPTSRASGGISRHG
jgi:hypothetical protein